MRHIIQRVDIDKSIPQWKIVCTCGYESLGATEEEAKLIIARNNDDEYVLREFASGNTFLNIEDLLADDWFVEVQR